MLLRGSAEIAKHILSAFPSAYMVQIYSQHRPRWTHRLFVPEEADVAPLAKLLQKVLVLRVPNELDGAIALDFYNRPAPPPSTGLQYTDTAKLIRMVKYENRQRKISEVREAGKRLSSCMADVVKSHDWFQTTSLIIAAPGHTRATVSASVRIGHTIAHECELPQEQVLSSREWRKSAKDMTSAELAGLLDEYTVSSDLTGRCVLLVDDVFHTGSTLRGLAAAARRAGATTVLGLVAARTLSL
ncbi:hypothetical protein GCM10017790_38140 [Amycolatopsis oliviviridis]|uniref:Phosphoribosyltransferase domain-containing protein n=2 Tax=Amycolatopsis oliviviridis TaxID=1471590 RepID=A0ABQ3LLX7_9PSEU|nr:hypothetical protein GCM10017790_38140 [Amycolatopsis oliviviridis]